MKKAIIALLCASVLVLSGCHGSYGLTKKLLRWNGTLGNKWLNSCVHFLMWVVPIYPISLGLVDWLVLNTVEFWTGSNPLAADDSYYQKDEQGNSVAAVKNEAGDILDAFAFAKTDRIRGEEHGVTAELVHAHLESRNSSQRRFFEEHGDVLAVETVRNLAGVNFGFETRGNLDGFENFFFAPVGQAEEVFVAIYHFYSFGRNPIYRMIFLINRCRF